jgi:CheY-like chemotaxis protein
MVEDDVDSRSFITFALEQAGATVTPVASGQEALQSVAHSLPDVVVSDIEMPEMNGYELVQQIRRRTMDQGGGIPAIALTAHAGEFNQQKALEAGFQEHFAKPADLEQLVRAIAQWTQPRSKVKVRLG